MQELTLHTPDGATLAARLFPAATPVGAVLMAGAFGVPQGFYRRYATFLAEHGLTTLTLDYRGIGGSRPANLRGWRATLRDWGENDLAAGLDALERLAPGLRIVWMAHSFGGQALGLAPVHGRIAGVVAYGSQLGSLHLWPAPARLFRRGQLAVGAPIVHALGYAPGWLGLGEDVPRDVMLEWGRWCRSPGYLLDHVPGAADAFGSLDVPVTLMYATDDAFAPYAAVQALATLLPRARVVALDPADLDRPKIGHFSWFKSGSEPLWRPAVDELRTIAQGG
jgi:predicted alpha/beta hydrolase